MNESENYFAWGLGEYSVGYARPVASFQKMLGYDNTTGVFLSCIARPKHYKFCPMLPFFGGFLWIGFFVAEHSMIVPLDFPPWTQVIAAALACLTQLTPQHYVVVITMRRHYKRLHTCINIYNAYSVFVYVRALAWAA